MLPWKEGPTKLVPWKVRVRQVGTAMCRAYGASHNALAAPERCLLLRVEPVVGNGGSISRLRKRCIRHPRWEACPGFRNRRTRC